MPHHLRQRQLIRISRHAEIRPALEEEMPDDLLAPADNHANTAHGAASVGVAGFLGDTQGGVKAVAKLLVAVDDPGGIVD